VAEEIWYQNICSALENWHRSRDAAPLWAELHYIWDNGNRYRYILRYNNYCVVVTQVVIKALFSYSWKVCSPIRAYALNRSWFVQHNASVHLSFRSAGLILLKKFRTILYKILNFEESLVLWTRNIPLDRDLSPDCWNKNLRLCDWAFPVADDARIWNSLPQDVTSASLPHVLKASLTIFLFSLSSPYHCKLITVNCPCSEPAIMVLGSLIVRWCYHGIALRYVLPARMCDYKALCLCTPIAAHPVYQIETNQVIWLSRRFLELAKDWTLWVLYSFICEQMVNIICSCNRYKTCYVVTWFHIQPSNVNSDNIGFYIVKSDKILHYGDLY